MVPPYLPLDKSHVTCAAQLYFLSFCVLNVHHCAYMCPKPNQEHSPYGFSKYRKTRRSLFFPFRPKNRSPWWLQNLQFNNFWVNWRWSLAELFSVNISDQLFFPGNFCLVVVHQQFGSGCISSEVDLCFYEPPLDLRKPSCWSGRSFCWLQVRLRRIDRIRTAFVNWNQDT